MSDKSMATILAATMMMAGGAKAFDDALGIPGDKTAEPPMPKKCSLPECKTTITYNGGYCCAEHARLHHAMVKEQNKAIQRNMRAKRKRHVSK